MSRTRYFLVSWIDHQRKGRAPRPTTREYGTTTTKQAAIRLAERVLPPEAEYVVTTLSRTIHQGRTPAGPRARSRGGSRRGPRAQRRPA